MGPFFEKGGKMEYSVHALCGSMIKGKKEMERLHDLVAGESQEGFSSVLVISPVRSGELSLSVLAPFAEAHDERLWSGLEKVQTSWSELSDLHSTMIATSEDALVIIKSGLPCLSPFLLAFFNNLF